MTFGSGEGIFGAIGAVDQQGADVLVHASIEGGMNFFDTSDNYSEGDSELVVPRTERGPFGCP